MLRLFKASFVINRTVKNAFFSSINLDKTPPKKPLNGFMKYLLEKMNEHKDPNMKHKELLKNIGAQWKLLDESEKTRYSYGVKEEMEQYKLEMVKYKDSLTQDERDIITSAAKKKKVKLFKAQLKKEGKPKRPLNPFLLFQAEQHPLFKDLSFQDFSKKMGENWKSLPEERKAQYAEAFAKAKVQYEIDLENWEQKMTKEGKPF